MLIGFSTEEMKDKQYFVVVDSFNNSIIDAYTTIEEKILRFICKYPQKKVYM